MKSHIHSALLVVLFLLAGPNLGALQQPDSSGSVGPATQTAGGSRAAIVVGQQAGKDKGQPAGQSRPSTPAQAEEATRAQTNTGDHWQVIRTAKTVAVIGMDAFTKKCSRPPFPCAKRAKEQAEISLRKSGRFSLVEDPTKADLVVVAMESSYIDSVMDQTWVQLRVFRGPASLAFLAQVQEKLGAQLRAYTGPAPMEKRGELLWEGWRSSKQPEVKNPAARRRPGFGQLLALAVVTNLDKETRGAAIASLTGATAKELHTMVAEDFCRAVAEGEKPPAHSLTISAAPLGEPQPPGSAAPTQRSQVAQEVPRPPLSTEQPRQEQPSRQPAANLQQAPETAPVKIPDSTGVHVAAKNLVSSESARENDVLEFEVENASFLRGATLPQSEETSSALSGEQVVERVSPSVVLILVGERGEKLTGIGSGIIVRPEGIILTAYHLVRHAGEAQVRLKNGETFDKVEIVGVDERRDVAALRISAHSLPALSIAKVEEAKPGETVFVVSNPGALAWTASSGILSATRLADEVPGAGRGFRLLQFTAPVSPGSSGGALVDAYGRALGIVTGSEQGQNLNFAVPVESVLGLAEGTGRILLGSGGGLRLPQGERPTVPAPKPPASGGAPQSEPTAATRSVLKVFVEGEERALGFPADPVQKKLLEKPEFQSGEFQLVENEADADLVVQLRRQTLTWDFTFRMVHPASGRIVGSGKKIAWDGIRAAPSVADQIMKYLQALRPKPAAGGEKKK